jgi:hypothetical protein
MTNDTNGLCFIIVGEVFLWLVNCSIVLYFGGRFRSTYPPISLEYQPLQIMKPSLLTFEPFLTYTLIGPWRRLTSKMFSITFFELLFLESCVMSRGLWQTLSFLLNCFMVLILFFITNMGGMWRGSPLLNHLHVRHGDPLGGLLFVLAHYWVLLKTITWVPNYSFPSLADDTHIAGPISEINHAFNHLSIQLALIGLKVKVSKYKLWSPSRIFPSVKIL